jgi:hypothetical protein
LLGEADSQEQTFLGEKGRMLKPTEAKKSATDFVTAHDKKLYSLQACLEAVRAPIMRSFSISDFSI